MFIFHVTLYIALFICAAGTIYRAYKWFSLNVLPDLKLSTGQRCVAALKHTLKVIFSSRILSIFKSILLDLLLQVPILKAGFFRWLMHMSIFWGFVILVFMHALDETVTANLFSDYASTLNPYFSIRNVLGLMVIIGICIALFRRLFIKKGRELTNKSDIFALILLAIILGTGFLLESSQIISAPIFDEMVDEYAGISDPEEALPLKAYWEDQFFVVFPEKINPVDPEVMAEGLSQHTDSCIDCHSKPQAAFISLPLASILKPFGRTLNAIRFDRFLWYIHFLATFLGLALLPFSKFLHIITTPLQMIIKKSGAKSGPEPQTGYPADSQEMKKENERLLSLDACTHCGVCSLHCSVAPIYDRHPNRTILPSEKLIVLKQLVQEKPLSPQEIASFSEGSYFCTSCYRCTELCPSGINLHDLWLTSKTILSQKGYPEAYHWVRKHSATQWSDKIKAFTPKKVQWSQSGGYEIRLTDKPQTFSSCVQCTTCTNVCPVVAASDDPTEDLDFTPQQIMNLLRLELKEAVWGSRMVWNCLTCYMCQEHCPQGVRVTDVLYELRNQAYEKFKTVKQRESDLDRNEK